MDFHRFLVPRLEGDRIDQGIDHYIDLVRKGVAGFIVFGGEVGTLREGIRRLQAEAELPLIIASDLEQGLGQQVRGGTTFPPAAAVAMAEASRPGMARQIFSCMAREAAHAGINTVFAPVLDVDTNPENPIIATRAFGSEPGVVAELGSLMVSTFREHGVTACGKHFPGHGGTSADSHLDLPVIEKSVEELEACELIPFRKAVASGLRMVMLGHLGVPALEPSGAPASLSENAVRFLNEAVGFPADGIVVTDAMDMGALGSYTDAGASLMSLQAGADVLLHPREPGKLAKELGESGMRFGSAKLDAFRRSLPRAPAEETPPPHCTGLSIEATRAAIREEGPKKDLRRPHVIVLSDDGDKGRPFVSELTKRYNGLQYTCLTDGAPRALPAGGQDLVVAVFSDTRAWKGGTAPWVKHVLGSIGDRADFAISFGRVHLLNKIGPGVRKIYAWWDSEEAQSEVARRISSP